MYLTTKGLVTNHKYWMFLMRSIGGMQGLRNPAHGLKPWFEKYRVGKIYLNIRMDR